MLLLGGQYFFELGLSLFSHLGHLFASFFIETTLEQLTHLLAVSLVDFSHLGLLIFGDSKPGSDEFAGQGLEVAALDHQPYQAIELLGIENPLHFALVFLGGLLQLFHHRLHVLRIGACPWLSATLGTHVSHRLHRRLAQFLKLSDLVFVEFELFANFLHRKQAGHSAAHHAASHTTHPAATLATPAASARPLGHRTDAQSANQPYR